MKLSFRPKGEILVPTKGMDLNDFLLCSELKSSRKTGYIPGNPERFLSHYVPSK